MCLNVIIMDEERHLQKNSGQTVSRTTICFPRAEVFPSQPISHLKGRVSHHVYADSATVASHDELSQRYW